jgi:hypothetical protein
MMTKSFETFSDISHIPLRVYNRVVYMTNLLSDFGKDAAATYAAMFTESERKQMYVMQAFISAKGVDEARKAATKGLEIVYDAA